MDNKRQLDFFCENLQNLRKQRGLTQTEMAQLLHISVGYVRRIEKGEIPPRLTVDIFYRIYSIFEIFPEQLVAGLLEQA